MTIHSEAVDSQSELSLTYLGVQCSDYTYLLYSLISLFARIRGCIVLCLYFVVLDFLHSPFLCLLGYGFHLAQVARVHCMWFSNCSIILYSCLVSPRTSMVSDMTYS